MPALERQLFEDGTVVITVSGVHTIEEAASMVNLLSVISSKDRTLILNVSHFGVTVLATNDRIISMGYTVDNTDSAKAYYAMMSAARTLGLLG